MGTLLAEGVQHFHREEATHGERSILRRADMALTHNKAVAVGPLWILRVYVHLAEIAGGDELGNGEAGRRDARTALCISCR